LRVSCARLDRGIYDLWAVGCINIPSFAFATYEGLAHPRPRAQQAIPSTLHSATGSRAALLTADFGQPPFRLWPAPRQMIWPRGFLCKEHTTYPAVPRRFATVIRDLFNAGRLSIAAYALKTMRFSTALTGFLCPK